MDNILTSFEWWQTIAIIFSATLGIGALIAFTLALVNKFRIKVNASKRGIQVENSRSVGQGNMAKIVVHILDIMDLRSKNEKKIARIEYRDAIKEQMTLVDDNFTFIVSRLSKVFQDHMKFKYPDTDDPKQNEKNKRKTTYISKRFLNILKVIKTDILDLVRQTVHENHFHERGDSPEEWNRYKTQKLQLWHTYMLEKLDLYYDIYNPSLKEMYEVIADYMKNIDNNFNLQIRMDEMINQFLIISQNYLSQIKRLNGEIKEAIHSIENLDSFW